MDARVPKTLNDRTINMTRRETTPRLLTPLLIATAAVVTTLALMKIILEPQDILTWTVSLVFLPVAIGILSFTNRRITNPEQARKMCGNLRAGLVGAGVMLATSLGFSLTDGLGWTGQDGQFAGRPLLMFVPSAIAVAAELIGARLEYAAGKDPKDKMNNSVQQRDK